LLTGHPPFDAHPLTRTFAFATIPSFSFVFSVPFVFSFFQWIKLNLGTDAQPYEAFRRLLRMDGGIPLMKKSRIVIFGLILTGAVVAAVGTLVAQTPAPDPQAEPRGRARAMVLMGRGSQIGAMTQDLTAEEIKGLSGVTSGVRIQEVDEDSPAAKAGLREGDIVVEFDGERIRSARQFGRMVEETASGRTVRLGIVRNGQRQTVDVTPESRAFSWGFDGDRIGRDIARSLRDLEPQLREWEPRLREQMREIEPRLREQMRELEPRFREFQWDPPAFNFDYDWNMIPGTTRGRLGVQTETLTPQLADYFGVKDGGVLVSSVTPESAAAKAGLKAGDVITSIDGGRVRDYDDLLRELRDKSGEVTIGIVRDKKESTVKTTIEQSERRPRRPVRPV
jgi:serine protease Do